MVNRSPPAPCVASNKKFDRIGIVVFRSTTLCAAVSSRSSSARETVISRLPVGAGAALVSVGKVISGSWVALVTVGISGFQLVSLAKLYTEFNLRCILVGRRLLDSRGEARLSATDFFVETRVASVRCLHPSQTPGWRRYCS